MPDVILKVDTAVVVPVNVMPLLDDTDFKTIEAAIAYNASGLDLRWNFVSTAGVCSSTAVTPTTSGSYDWTHLGDGMYSIEIPASGGGSINNDTEGYGWFTGVITGVLPFRGPIIGFAPAKVVDSLWVGSDNLEVDTVQVAGTSQTAKDVGAAVPAAVPGAAGGLLIAGSNAATTVAAFTVTNNVAIGGTTAFTGNVVYADGVTIAAPSTANRPGLTITGNGAGAGVTIAAGATGVGVNVSTTDGHGLVIAATGNSRHGINVTGGTGGTSDGFKITAGTGGVALRTNITGDITGTLATVTTLTNLPAITANWLTATGIAADAITAAKLASDVGAEIADAVWDELASEHQIVDSFGEAYSAGVIDAGTAQAGGASSITLQAGAPSTNLAGAIVRLNSGPGKGESAIISAYDTSTKVATILGTWLTQPTTSTKYIVERATTTPLVTVTTAGITTASFATGAIDAAALAADAGTEIGAAVWASGTRVLTAGTNIVLAKGTGITGFNDLDTAGVATAVWNAATGSYGTTNSYGALIETNLDAMVSTRSTFAGGAVASVTAPVTVGTITDKTGYKLASDGVDAVVIEAGANLRQAMSGIFAAECGRLSGAATNTVVILGAGTAITRIQATVDPDGNRTAVILSLPA